MVKLPGLNYCKFPTGSSRRLALLQMDIVQNNQCIVRIALLVGIHFSMRQDNFVAGRRSALNLNPDPMGTFLTTLSQPPI